MNSNDSKASSNFPPFGTDKTGLPQEVTIAFICPSPSVKISSAKATTGNLKKKSRYRTMKSLMPVLELLFALFFTFVVVSNAIDGKWITTVLLLPFPVGFYFTSIPSLSRMFAGFSKNKVEESIDSGK